MKDYKIPRWLWYKKYFDVGLGMSSYFRYFLTIFGVYSLGKNIDINYMLYLGVFYSLGCFVFGWYWINKRLYEAENEINNVLNPFQKEVRKKLRRWKK